jgi:hypothetical protein
MIAASVASSVEASAASVKTSTASSVSASTTSVRASTTAAVTTAMLSEGWCGEANKAEGYDSGNKGLEQGGFFHS